MIVQSIFRMRCARLGNCMNLSRVPTKWVSISVERFSSEKLPTLTLFTKENCSLCDETMEVLEPYKEKFRLETVDITEPENKEWKRKYQYDIPVFHLDGQFLMKHRVDLDKFKRALSIK